MNPGKQSYRAILFLMALQIACSPSPKSQGDSTPATSHDEKMAWWREAKFGLFIHWGVYAVPAGKYGDKTNYGEWLMLQARIPVAEYKEYSKQFNPMKYDPAAWVRVAKEAGMKYIVITSKHHDGFALYPSDASDWDIADASPYGKDLLGPLVDEAKKAGLKIGFYYSQARDWTHPGGVKNGFPEGDGWDEDHLGDLDEYLEKVAYPQTREILSRYDIDILWWDGAEYLTDERKKPFLEALKTKPHVLTNNRMGVKGDYRTPEQFIPVTGHEGDWETCMTMNWHWGYNAYDHAWKSTEDLVHKLIEICSKGGNFLLNVGPTAEGELPPESIDRLQSVGKWLDVYGEAIYGTTRGPFSWLGWGAATRKGDLLYLHVHDWPENGKLNVPLTSKVARASLLVEPDYDLALHVEEERIVIDLPDKAPDTISSVVILKLEEDPVALPIASAGKRITATSEHPDHPARNAVDGTGEEIWQSADTTGISYLEFDLGTPTLIHATGVDVPDHWPRYRQNIRMEVKTPDDWKELFTRSARGHGFVNTFDPIVITKARLYVNREDGGAPSMAEWQLYAPE